MSMNDAERMITVAELLRREGFKQSTASRKRQKLAVAATGVVALAGATVTGMLVLAPKLSTSFSTEDGQLPVASGNGGSAATPSSNDAREAGSTPSTYVDVTTMAAVREAVEAPEPPVRIPAMSQIDRSAPAGERVRDSSRSSAGPAPARTTTRPPAEGSEKAPPRDDERRRSSSAESTESQAPQQPADEESQQPDDEETRQSEPEQQPSKQKPEREKQEDGSDEGSEKGSEEGSEKGSEKGSDQGKGAENGKGR